MMMMTIKRKKKSIIFKAKDYNTFPSMVNGFWCISHQNSGHHPGDVIVTPGSFQSYHHPQEC